MTESEPIQDLVRRLIREQLEQGGLQRLIETTRAVEAAGLVISPASAVVTITGGTPVITIGPALQGNGTLVGEVEVVEPSVQAETNVMTPQVVEAVRSTYPDLAREIEHRNTVDGTFLVALFALLVQLVQTALTAFQILHPQTPTEVVQIFNQIYNVVNPTNPVNPPPQH